MSTNGRDSLGRFTRGNSYGKGGPPGNVHAEGRATHGFKAMKRRLMELGSRFLDRRYAVGRELSDWRDSVINELGGSDSISTFQREMIDQLVADKLIVDSLGRWILAQGSIVNVKKKRITPAVLERAKLIDSMTKRMAMLGLDRKAKTVENDLDAYLKSISEKSAVNEIEGADQGTDKDQDTKVSE